MTFIALALVGALACDANADGRVTIDELLAGVHAALGDGCGVGCADSGACPDACGEFPAGTLDGVHVECEGSLCASTEECLRILDEHGLCHEVAP